MPRPSEALGPVRTRFFRKNLRHHVLSQATANTHLTSDRAVSDVGVGGLHSKTRHFFKIQSKATQLVLASLSPCRLYECSFSPLGFPSRSDGYLFPFRSALFVILYHTEAALRALSKFSFTHFCNNNGDDLKTEPYLLGAHRASCVWLEELRNVRSSRNRSCAASRCLWSRSAGC